MPEGPRAYLFGRSILSDNMELTRRDAVAALLAGGAAGPVVSGLRATGSSRETDELGDEEIRRLVAIGEVVFPADVQATEEYVREYVSGLHAEDRREISATLDELETYVSEAYGQSFAELPVGRREAVLRAMGVDRMGSAPDGSLPERVRFHLVNRLLYGLFTTPRGSQLVGIDNPVGYPGGYESYQQPPTDE